MTKVIRLMMLLSGMCLATVIKPYYTKCITDENTGNTTAWGAMAVVGSECGDLRNGIGAELQLWGMKVFEIAKIGVGDSNITTYLNKYGKYGKWKILYLTNVGNVSLLEKGSVQIKFFYSSGKTVEFVTTTPITYIGCSENKNGPLNFVAEFSLDTFNVETYEKVTKIVCQVVNSDGVIHPFSYTFDTSDIQELKKVADYQPK